MPQRKTDAQLLDEALLAKENGTYVDPVQGAKQFLSRQDLVADDANRHAAGDIAGAKAQRAAEGGAEKLPVMRRALDVAAIPAALIPNPLTPAAAAYLGVRGIGEAIEDPSAMNVGMAAAGALPFVKPVRNALKAGQEAKAISGIRNTYGAGDMGAAFSREKPFRMGGAVSEMRGTGTASSGNATTMADLRAEGGANGTVLQRAKSQVSDFLSRLGLGGDEAAATPAAANGGRFNPQRFLGDMMQELKGEFPPNRVNHVPAEAVIRPEELQPRSLDEAYRALGFEPPKAVPASVKSIAEATGGGKGRGVTSAVNEKLMGSHNAGWQDVPLGGADEVAASTPAKVNGRPAADFVHPEDTSGGMFGFDSLPELSEGELSRLQALFSRVTGR